MLFILVVVRHLEALFPCGQDHLGGVDGAEFLDGLAVKGGVFKGDCLDKVFRDSGDEKGQDRYPE